MRPIRLIALLLSTLAALPAHAATVTPVGIWGCILREPSYENHFTAIFEADGTLRERFDFRYPEALGVARYQGVLEGRWERRGIELHLTFETAKVETFDDPLYGDTVDLDAFEEGIIEQSSGVETIINLTRDSFVFGREGHGTIECKRAD